MAGGRGLGCGSRGARPKVERAAADLVQARYSHTTAEMRGRLMDGLTNLWNAALDQPLRLSEASPVAALDALLKARR